MTSRHNLRHPGLVPGSTEQQGAKLQPLVLGSRRSGSRDKPGMTLVIRTQGVAGPSAGAAT